MLEQRGQAVTIAMDFQADDVTLEKRVCGRLIHQASGRSYHEVFNPPKVPMIDDVSSYLVGIFCSLNSIYNW